MLIEFKVANYRSFRSEQTLSLIASNDTSLEQNLISIGKFSLLRSVAIYGPNASGKSNLIRALDTMKALVEKSASSKPGDIIPVSQFKLGEDDGSPSSFEVMFYHRDIRYQYGFSATSKCIHNEWLIAYPKEYAQKWFTRELNTSTNEYNWKFSPFLKGEKETLKDKTKNNSLFLSVAAQWNHEQLSIIYEWFSQKLEVVTSGSKLKPNTALVVNAFDSDPTTGKAMHDFLINFLKDADLGINEIKVTKDEFTESNLPDLLTPEVKEAFIKSYKDVVHFKVEFLHRNPVTGTDIAFPLEEESDGTRRLFELAGPWFETVFMGKTAAIDELDASLHPLLSRELIKFINKPPYSPSEAQLIFVTHDTSLLDPDLFRRDQIWFVEKSNNGESKLYSLADYKERKVRKGEALEKGYLSGRYGAIPILRTFGLYEHETTLK